MKVLAINGSPKKQGNTAAALEATLEPIAAAGIETEVLTIGSKPVRGCIGCGKCRIEKNNKCIFDDDIVNTAITKMIAADGIIFGTPVYFAGLNGTLKSLLDRAFYVAVSNGGLFRHKVGAAVAVQRRSGGIAALDSIYKFIQYQEMIQPGSNYWNIAHGHTPGEVINDTEGMQICRVLGQNITWLVKILDQTKDSLPPPAMETKVALNFIH